MASWRSLTVEGVPNPAVALRNEINRVSGLGKLVDPAGVFSNISGVNTLGLGVLGAGANMLLGGKLNALSKYGFKDPKWFISLRGKNQPFLEGNCGIDEISMSNGVEVPSAPMENGGFASFNIIDKPREIKIRFINANDPLLLAKQEQTIWQYMTTGRELDIITPTTTFRNFVIYNVNKASASSNGVNIGIYDISLREIQKVILARLASKRQVRNVTMTAPEKKGFIATTYSGVASKLEKLGNSIKDGVNKYASEAGSRVSGVYDSVSSGIKGYL